MPGFGTICQMPSFQWKIQNFWNLNVNYGNFIESPQFTLIGEKGMLEKFVFKLYPKGSTVADWVGLYLILVDGTKCTVSFKFSILDKYEKLFQVCEDYHRIFHSKTGYGFPKFVEINKLKSAEEIVLPNGTLTILVELNGIKDKPKDPTMCLADDLEKLTSNEDFSDVEIHCKDIRLKAHKAILASRSSVFQAMFTNPCKESQTGSVTINNMEPEVLKDLINFIYSCKVKKLKENVADLFIAADMYMMESLKGMLYVFFSARVGTYIVF